MREYDRIEDVQVSEELSIPLNEVREVMKSIAKRQERKEWLIAFINKRNVFYNSKFIDKFIKLYNEGLNEKNIFNALSDSYSIRSRAEIKAIEDILVEQEKIEQRDYATIKLLTFESQF